MSSATPDGQAWKPLRGHPRRSGCLVRGLRDLLGARLVAYLPGMKETRAVRQWADGERRIQDPEVERHLRVAFQAARMLTHRDSVQVAQTWFQGLNPHLDDRSPARMLREHTVEEVGPRVLTAARTFAAVARSRLPLVTALALHDGHSIACRVGHRLDDVSDDQFLPRRLPVPQCMS